MDVLETYFICLIIPKNETKSMDASEEIKLRQFTTLHLQEERIRKVAPTFHKKIPQIPKTTVINEHQNLRKFLELLS